MCPDCFLGLPADKHHSSKLEPTSKKSSNKRDKRKHSEIDEDTTKHAIVASDKVYKEDSEFSNDSVAGSTEVNIDEIATSDIKPDGDKTSIQDLIIGNKKKIKFAERNDLVKHLRTHTEENTQKVDTKGKHLMSTPTLKTDFQTYVNKRFIKECYLFHQLIMKKYNLTHHIHDYTDEELFSCLE